MNFKEIKPLSSIKYEFKGSQKYGLPPLYLKGMFSTVLPPKSNEPSTFIGFINGKNKAEKLNVFFTNTDKVVIENHTKRFHREGDVIFININHLSATRMPANISGSLKQICTQHAKYCEKKRLIKELEKEEQKEMNKFDSLFRESNAKYQKELKDDVSQYSPRDHIEKMIALVSSQTRMRWTSMSDSDFTMLREIETRISFNALPNGFHGYREYDGQAMLDSPDNATEVLIDYLKKLAQRNRYSQIDAPKLYNVFNELNKSIKKDKYKTFDVVFVATLSESGRNDATASIDFGFTFKVKEYSEKTHKELNAFMSKYKELVNSLN